MNKNKVERKIRASDQIPNVRRPSQRQIKRAIKHIAKDYGETIKKLAKV